MESLRLRRPKRGAARMASHSDTDKCTALELSSLPSSLSVAPLNTDCAYHANMMPAGRVRTVSMALKRLPCGCDSTRRLWVLQGWPAPSETHYTTSVTTGCLCGHSLPIRYLESLPVVISWSPELEPDAIVMVVASRRDLLRMMLPRINNISSPSSVWKQCTIKHCIFFQ